MVLLRQDLLRLRQLQGYSDNDFDGALDLVEAWLEMGYDFQGDTEEHGDSRKEAIIGDPETNQPTMDTSHDDQLELNNAEEVDKTSFKSLTDIRMNQIFKHLSSKRVQRIKSVMICKRIPR